MEPNERRKAHLLMRLDGFRFEGLGLPGECLVFHSQEPNKTFRLYGLIQLFANGSGDFQASGGFQVGHQSDGFWFGVQGLRFGVRGMGFRISSLGFRA